MKKLFTILLAMFLLSCTGSEDKAARGYKETYVYICNGPKSQRYHSTRHCKGLSKCSTDIIPVTKAEAESMGRTPCGWCY